MARTPRLRHNRRRNYDRIRRGTLVPAFCEARATDLNATGTGQTFDTAVEAAVGTLTFGANAGADETVTIGTTVYTYKAVIEAVAATGTLTFGANASAAEIVTIGTTVYTFVSSLVSAYDVLVGATASDSLDNLIAAINHSAGEGSTYGTGTVAHPSVTAAAGAGDTMDVTAITAGVAGNSIASTTDVTSASWGAATLQNGKDAEAAYAVEIGATASDSLDNLIAAVNGSAGEGTTYGTGTVAHADVTAAAGVGDTVDVTAIVAGAAGNSIASTTDVTSASWGGATLSGGVTSNALAITTHGHAVGDGPFVATTSGTLPGGLTAGTLYWVESVPDANSLTLTAKRGGGAITITADGTGTQTLTPADTAAAVFELTKTNPIEVVRDATDVDDLI